MTTRNRKPLALVAELCLYGNRETGAGFILAYADGTMYGDGEPKGPHYSFTACIWDCVREAFAMKGRGLVRVFDAGGERMADVVAGELAPTYGMMKWQPAIVYSISSEEITKAAQA